MTEPVMATQARIPGSLDLAHPQCPGHHTPDQGWISSGHGAVLLRLGRLLGLHLEQTEPLTAGDSEPWTACPAP